MAPAECSWRTAARQSDEFISQSTSLSAVIGPPPAPSPTMYETPELHALVRSTLAAFEEYVGLQRRIPSEVVAMIQSAEGIDRQAYGMAAHCVRQGRVKSCSRPSRSNLCCG